jgi:hypothetical protein
MCKKMWTNMWKTGEKNNRAVDEREDAPRSE